jgi:lysophospholipase L1-like esterase
MTTRARTVVATGALALVSAALVVALVEAALRLSGFTPAGERAVRRMVDARWTTLLDCFPSNPRGYFSIDLQAAEGARYRRLAPHRFDAIARDHRWAVESRYNELRFREVPPEPKPSGVKRVVIFGDSFAEGQGVKQADTLAPALQRVLEARAPGRYQVRNCGRRGLDFPELHEAFSDALFYEPDLVVYTLTLNDAVQPPGFRALHGSVNDWILDRTRSPDGPLEPYSPLRPRVFDFVKDRLDALSTSRETTRWYLDMWGEANRAGRDETEEHLRRMQRQLEASGARLLVAPWPLFVGLERGYPFAPVHDVVRRFCLAAGIPHHELLETFAGRRTEELWVHPVDHHPNEAAHRLAAESLAPVVLKLAP